MRIDVIHAAAGAVNPLHEIFRELSSETEVVDHLNEEMLEEVQNAGKVTPHSLRMFAEEVFQAADAGTDGILIACSVFCSYAGLMRCFVDAPVLAIDEPAIRTAVERGGKIGILATTPPSAPACQKKMEQEAEKQHQKLEYETGITEEALSALKAGEPSEHDRLIIDQANKLINKGCTVLFLSQVTMARALESMPEEMKKITITTASEGVKAILKAAEDHCKTKSPAAA